jgi:hypothetical protein
MREILDLLERQARWQRNRKQLSWAEKVHMIEGVKEGYARWLAAVRRPVAPAGNYPKSGPKPPHSS